MNKLIALLALCSGLYSAAAIADAQARLEAFIQGTKGLKAEFSQTVRDRTGRKTQEATGEMFFSRPGKFRWVYRQPYAQLIVGDGSRLWVYDEDLNQVTVRALDQSIGESPAALLAGNNDIKKLFNLRETAAREGLSWLEATPKSREGSFELVRMGFRGNDLHVLELQDNFGQTTLIRFTRMQRNPALGASLFRFTPPKGADVIGER